MAERPTRIDLRRLEYVGARLQGEWGFTTGCSKYEGHEAFDISLGYNGRDYGAEVKTVRQRFNASKRLYVAENSNWLGVDTDVVTGRTWMLNVEKFKAVVSGHECLFYLFYDGILCFSPRALRRAYMGRGCYYTTQRSEFEAEKRKPTWQDKAVINLECGFFLEGETPEELMASETHEDFNKNNGKRFYIYG